MTRTDWTDREVAAALRKSVRTVQRWCDAGKLPGAHKAGRSWRIPGRALTRAQVTAVRAHHRRVEDQVRAELRTTTKLLDDLDLSEVDAAAVRVDLDRLLAAVKRVGRASQGLRY